MTCLITDITCVVSLFNGPLYFLFQLLGIFVPGLAIYTIINKKITIDNTTIIWSYLLGLLVMIVEYFVVALLSIQNLSIVLALIIAVISIYTIYKNKDNYLEKEYSIDDLLLLIIICLTVFISFMAISYPYHSPDVYGGTYYNKDFLFWVGNSITFTKGLPAQNFRLVGYNFYYHYFSNIIIAQSSNITGLDIIVLSYYYSYIVPCILLVLSSYEMFKKLLKNRLLIFIGVVSILLCEGSTVFLPDHLYYCPFGFDYGYALGIYTIAQLIKVYSDNDYSIKNILSVAILVFLNAGFKAPLALVALMFVALICLALLFEKRIKESFSLGLISLFAFLFVYFVFVRGFESTNEPNGLQFLGLGGAFDQNVWAISIFSEIKEKYSLPDNAITRLIAIFLYVFRSNRVAMSLAICAVLLLLWKLIRNRKLEVIESSLLVTSLWGILLTILTHQDGNSQMYFMLMSIPYTILAGLSMLEKTFDNKTILYACAVLLLLIGFDDYHRFIQNRISNNIKDSIASRNGEAVNVDLRYYFTDEDYQLCLWLKDNTESNDYIVLDHYEYDDLRKEEGFGVLAERFFWNDGQYGNEAERQRRRDLVLDVINGNKDSLNYLINEKVRYLIVNTDLNKLDSSINLSKVYNTGKYEVYKLY